VKRLRVLSLAGNYLGEKGIFALASSPHLTGLEALDLSFTSMSKAAAVSLFRSPVLANITALRLGGNGFDKAVRDLVASPYLEKLSFLDLRENPLNDGAKKALRERWPFALM
jgi:hypothetical protein